MLQEIYLKTLFVVYVSVEVWWFIHVLSLENIKRQVLYQILSASVECNILLLVDMWHNAHVLHCNITSVISMRNQHHLKDGNEPKLNQHIKVKTFIATKIYSTNSACVINYSFCSSLRLSTIVSLNTSTTVSSHK